MDVNHNFQDPEEHQPFLKIAGGKSNVTRRMTDDRNNRLTTPEDSYRDKAEKKKKFFKNSRSCLRRCGICGCWTIVLFWLWWLSGQAYGEKGPCYGLEKVSLVVSWVNITDVNWQAESVEAGCPVEYALSGKGDGDPFEALRYNLRAVHKNLPFVNHVYLITTGQYPTWLDPDQDFVTVLPHKEFTTPSRTLFNGRTVAALWGVIGSKFAGKCFLHNDDDFIVNRPLTIDHFFPNGHVRVQPWVNINLGDWPLFSLLVWWYGSDLNRIVQDAHTTYAIHSDTFEQYCSESVLCQNNRKGTCNGGRKPIESEYDAWMATRTDVSFWSNYDIAWRSNRFVFGVPWSPPWLSLLGLLLSNPAHINIRSHGNIDTDPNWVNTIRAYLHWRFPRPAPWERQEQPDWIIDGKLQNMS